MQRRNFIGALGTAVLWPIIPCAEERLPLIGYLSARSAPTEAPLREPFLKMLEAAGFVVGKNINIEYRHAQGRNDLLPELTSELVRMQPAILVATDNASSKAVKSATSTIPIVFSTGDDPVKLGFRHFCKPLVWLWARPIVTTRHDNLADRWAVAGRHPQVVLTRPDMPWSKPGAA